LPTCVLVSVHAGVGPFAVVLVGVHTVAHAAAACLFNVGWSAWMVGFHPFVVVFADVGDGTVASHALVVVLTRAGMESLLLLQFG
jgi:hypothetical protein